ncbi:hypothetical protein SAMN05216417_13311 [Nitrosospira multiformis]|uniref:Uncharacterized protein n=1 Tax=Nitrosospira multiformis TaxID=1231 RepID=A0A1I7IYT8_9PROT|nr:hypothetical protein SAMN05216417_13311 [Nitrosospira multiformis]
MFQLWLHTLIKIVAPPEQEVVHAQKRNLELSCLTEVLTIKNGLEATKKKQQVGMNRTIGIDILCQSLEVFIDTHIFLREF